MPHWIQMDVCGVLKSIDRCWLAKFSDSDMRDTLGVLLAGGAGERLFPLTRDRAKPAVPFGGHYRIIDITLSNCINSGLRKVYILTQYKALSLNRHIREGWTGIVAQELGEFFEMLPPMQRTGSNWYMGTADAVYQNIYSIGSEQPKHMIILSGDHIYKMDYSRMLEHHKETKAEVTLATLPIRPMRSPAVRRGRGGRPARSSASRRSRPPTTFRSPFNPNAVDASMGIYIFNTEVLLKALIADAEDPNSKHDFGHNILPNLLGKKKDDGLQLRRREQAAGPLLARRGHPRRLLRRQHGPLLGLADFNLYDKSWPMRTRVRQYPPAKFVFGEPGRTGMAINSVITAGVIISGARCRTPSSRRMCASTPTPTSTPASSFPTSTSAATAASAAPSSTATSTSPKAPSSATTPSKTSAATSSRRPA
jgi:glucose-1-phosphate adenylyltransferase